MAKGQVVGHVDCPLCGLEAEVKEDKNGNPYAFCPDCTMQLLTHGGHRAELLRRKMRPVAQAVADALEPEPAAGFIPAAEPVKETTKPASRRTLLG